MLSYLLWSCLFILSSVIMITGGLLDKRQHQTNASLEKMNDLTCFQCATMSIGEKCSNLSSYNNSKLQQKCKGDKKTCMVKRYSYSTSTENSTSDITMWSLERSCASKCENGCIVIGERTKLYACTTCCYTSLCNVRNESNCTCSYLGYCTLMVMLLFNLNNN